MRQYLQLTYTQSNTLLAGFQWCTVVVIVIAVIVVIVVIVVVVCVL